jgi:hypothetical protein
MRSLFFLSSPRFCDIYHLNPSPYPWYEEKISGLSPDGSRKARLSRAYGNGTNFPEVRRSAYV